MQVGLWDSYSKLCDLQQLCAVAQSVGTWMCQLLSLYLHVLGEEEWEDHVEGKYTLQN